MAEQLHAQCPYPLKVQAHPPLATQSRVSGWEGVTKGAIEILKQLRSMSDRLKKPNFFYLLKSITNDYNIAFAVFIAVVTVARDSDHKVTVICHWF